MKLLVLSILSIILLSDGYAAVSLVEQGKATGKIIVPENPCPSENLAVKELDNYIKKMSGTTLPVTSSPCANSVTIGTVDSMKSLPREIKKRLNECKSNEAFYIKTIDNKIYIVGKNPIGALYGTYTFLEKYLGVRWFYPGGQGEYFPRKKTISFSAIDDFQAPDFSVRSLCLTCASWDFEDAWEWMVRNKMQISATGWQMRKYPKKEKQEYRAARNAIVRGGGHWGFRQAIPTKKYAKTHPEYFSLIDGKRLTTGRTQRCLSNPEVQKLYEESVYRQVKDGKVYLFGAEDTTKTFCQCDNCRKMGTVNGEYKLANVIHKFFSDIARRVKKRCPEAKFEVWMYNDFREVPEATVKYPENTIGMYCSHGRCYVHRFNDPACKMNQAQYREFRDWRKIVPNVALREYIECANNLYAPFEFVLAQDLKNLKKIGGGGWKDELMPVNGKMTPENAKKHPDAPFEWLSNWQTNYIAAKLLWNSNLDAGKLLDDAYTRYYGKAAPVMKKYHALRKKLWENAPGHAWYPGPQRTGYCLIVPGAEKQLNTYLFQAEKEASGNAMVLKRIVMDKKFLNKFWKQGAEKLKSIMSADKKIVPVESKEKIVLDGDLSENVWFQARPVTGFLSLKTGQPPAEKTSVRIAYDKDNIYFGVVAATEKLWGKEKAGAKTRDGKVWEDDSIEILLAPPNADGDYYQFIVNTEGVIYDSARNGSKADLSHDSKAEVKTRKSDGRRIYEVKLPLKPMKAKIEPGQTWKMHFVRNCRSLQPPAENETSTIDATRPHSVTSFRHAVFGKNIVRNGTFGLLAEYRGANRKKIKGGKFPKYWGAAGGREFSIEPSKNGNKVRLEGGTIYSFMDICRDSDPVSLDISVTASGTGKMFVMVWTWLYNKKNYLERVESKKDKLKAITVPEKPETFHFKYKCRANTVGYIYIYSREGILTVSHVSVVASREK